MDGLAVEPSVEHVTCPSEESENVSTHSTMKMRLWFYLVLRVSDECCQCSGSPFASTLGQIYVLHFLSGNQLLRPKFAYRLHDEF